MPMYSGSARVKSNFWWPHFSELTCGSEITWDWRDYRDFRKWGAWTKFFYFTRYEEAIKNALKWRKPDLSSFISKKKLYFLLENLI